MKRLRLLLIALNLVWIAGGCIPDEPVNSNYTDNFEALWKIIDERYCFLEEKGINWDQVHTHYSARLQKGQWNDITFFRLMEEMLNELKDGHVNLYSNFDISVYPITPDPTTGLNIYARQRHLSGQLMLSGGMRYGLYSTENKEVTFGYMAYGSFSNSVGNILFISKLFENADAIILDIRGNGGGSVENADKLASFFLKEKTLVGYTVYKTGPGRRDFSAPKANYISPHSSVNITEKPVFVLQDRSTYSAANDFLYKVSYADNITRIGEMSGGGAGMPASAELPNGWKIRYSAVKSYDRDMNLLEGGIVPHIEVHNESYYENPAASDQILITAVKKIYELKGLTFPEE
ncbi:MAG: S41 family peptidase [Porphyromonas sp.]|nr:S41 family peptidase [Porphyromonas sp.]